MLVGMDRWTGAELSGAERAAQSIETVLTTPFKSQPGMRAFGSSLPEQISRPLSADTFMDVFGALIDAFAWEPEAELVDYGISAAEESGRAEIWYRFRYLPSDELVTRIIGKAGR